MHRNFIYLLLCFAFPFNVLFGQKSNIEKTIKNTSYPRNGAYQENDNWVSSELPLSVSSSDSPGNELLTQAQKQQEDKSLERKHTQYQAYLKKAKAKKQNVLKEPELLEVPKFESPDVDEPNIGKLGKIPTGLLKVILVFIVVALLILIFYQRFKKGIRWQKRGSKQDNYWNPEVVTQSDLENRLAKALKKEKFREAVRIYFTLILKELIRLNQIRWAKEKTNHEYLNTLKNKGLQKEFAVCIHVFDVVWYGEYEIDQEKFNEVGPKLTAFLTKLRAQNP
jgi:hypothetical protein